MTQAEMIRRLDEVLALYLRVIHPVAGDPVRQALDALLHDVAADPRIEDRYGVQEFVDAMKG